MLLFCKQINTSSKSAILPVAVLGIYPTNCCLTGGEENRLPHYDNESEENRRAREYRKHVAERAAEGIAPKPLEQTKWPRL